MHRVFNPTSVSLVTFVVLVTLYVASPVLAGTYTITDAAGPARVFDGIGGLSGGGATSVLLWTYPQAERDAILDFLFKPNFGASLHILKVEIGGDAQSTDGAEPSHMHTPWDENYERGYEWWLMREAKKRNPNIKLYGLAWAYPQWVTCAPDSNMEQCTGDIYAYPNVTATYITKWIAGAKVTYGLDIDYVGCWNERPWNDTYLKTLRNTLDNAGFSNTKIVAPDGIAPQGWGLANDVLASPSLADAIYAIGAHYPGTLSTPAAEQTGKPLWASEDDSTYNNNVGAGCWARILNQNYVNGNMTASIIWNLIASYMKGTNWYRAGLMSAMQPWVGSYGTWHANGEWTVGPMIWASAHTTQFSEPGTFAYLAQGAGAGHLSNGGSYVTLKNFNTNDFTIVIEKMADAFSSCVRPALPSFDTSNELVVLKLDGTLLKNSTVKSLYVWRTHWSTTSADPEPTEEFVYVGAVPIEADGTISLNVTVNSLYTLTTIATGHKGAPNSIPAQPTLFPEYFADTFEDCRISGEGKYFADQNGIFECVLDEGANSGQNIVMKQRVPLRPVTWGGDIRPHSLIGHRDGVNTSLQIDGRITEADGSVLLGVRAQGTDNSLGLLFGLQTSGAWGIWSSILAVGDVSSAVANGQVNVSVGPILTGQWYRYRIDVNGTTLNVWIDGWNVIDNLDVSSLTDGITGGLTAGHGLIGTMAYGQYTEYDNIVLYSTYDTSTSNPAQSAVAGDAVCIAECNSEVGLIPNSQWSFAPWPNSQQFAPIYLRNQPTLCLTANEVADVDGVTQPWWLTVKTCTSAGNQLWAWTFDGISPDLERPSYIYTNGTAATGGQQRCLDIYSTHATVGVQMDAWPCNFGLNQAFFYDTDAAEVANEGTATCLGICKN